MLPILPIILAVSALGSGIVQGISSAKNAKEEAKALQSQSQEQINERAKAAKKLMQQQKTSFLKSGIYFDSGTPTDIINETYNTYSADINTLKKDTNTKVNNLMRQGKTAFFSSLLQSSANAAMSYFMAGGETPNLSNSSLVNNFKNWYQNKQKVVGDFDIDKNIRTV